MLQFDGLNKAYGDKQVLRNLSGHFEAGAFALQGPNGIGKSTLLSVLAGILPADSGEISIDRQSLHRQPLAAKSRLSYVPDECPVYPFMRGREFLRFVAHAKGCALAPHIFVIAERFQLNAHLDTNFVAMSLGTQKKMMLCAAWIGDPAVMLIDEPSNGLDRAARDVLIELLKERRKVSTMLISTHDVNFTEAIGASVVAFSALQRT